MSERPFDRVRRLSPSQLALLSLRLGHRVGHRPTAEAGQPASPASTLISAEAGPRVDELSDEQVDALLERILRERLPGGKAPDQPPVLVPASGQYLGANLLERLDELSEEEVDSLLAEQLGKAAK